MLVISDTNIIIDIEEGGITSLFFELGYNFCVPDILFFEELEELHAHLLGMGLQVKELSSHSMKKAESLIEKHSTSKAAPSRSDCFALVLALQENTRLLTGDQRLRQAAKEEGVTEVNGILWVVGQMITEGLLTVDEARTAYDKMISAGSWLPRNDIEQQLQGFNV